ncbi:MAG: nucleotidyltransferase domain-containing protein, partial [Bacteroidota bacterium]
VTQPGRLWIARTLLILYKKVFLFNSRRNFCVNYFVDTDHLLITDRNIFTATELAFLLPAYSAETYLEFRNSNDWVRQFYPHFPPRATEDTRPTNRNVFRRFGEWILGGRLGERIDTWCLKRTLRRWKKKFSDFDDAKFDVTLRSRKYVSKHHPSDFQARVTNALRDKIAAFEGLHHCQLSPETSE